MENNSASNTSSSTPRRSCCPETSACPYCALRAKWAAAKQAAYAAETKRILAANPESL